MGSKDDASLRGAMTTAAINNGKDEDDVPSTSSRFTFSLSMPRLERKATEDANLLLPGRLFTSVAGTFGYIDPEYHRTSRATLKSDVFSFGVLMLELIMGVPPTAMYDTLISLVHDTDVVVTSYERCLTAMLAHWTPDTASGLTAALGQKHVDSQYCFRATGIAQQCMQEKGRLRPSMRKVVQMFEQMNEERQSKSPRWRAL